jgi:hypothetical protein
LKELNFDRNLLKNEEFHFEKIQPFIVEQDNTKKFKLSLNDNYFNRDEIPMEYRNWCYLLRQGTYVFQRVNFYNVHEDNIRNQVFQIPLEIDGIETVEKVKNVFDETYKLYLELISKNKINDCWEQPALCFTLIQKDMCEISLTNYVYEERTHGKIADSHIFNHFCGMRGSSRYVGMKKYILIHYQVNQIKHIIYIL